MGRFDFTAAEHPSEHSVLSEMAIDVAVNDRSQLMILHEKPFKGGLSRIEYHHASGALIFAEGNQLRDLGMPVPSRVRARLEATQQAHLFLMEGSEKIAGFQIVPVIHIQGGVQ